MKQLLVYIRDNKLKNDFENTIDAYIASCNDQGVEPSKPYGGKLIVHMPPDPSCNSSSGSRQRSFV